MRRKTLLPIAAVALFLVANRPPQPALYGKKIDSLVSQMTTAEKIGMLHGSGMFYSGGVQRLGVPELTYADGPLGVREEVERTSWASAKWTTDSATFFPNGSALAATWNPDLAYRYGTAIGGEARARNKDILLAPAINITRTPLGGRTFEYLSEDPLLNSKLAVAAVKGIQSQDVAACVKHFAVNNQETNRGKVDVTVGERALREIYLPAFKACITEGKALTVMAAYNKFRGAYCSENDVLLNKILRGEWGFKGLVMSDWGGVHSTVAAARNGLDIEMGSTGPFANWYFANPLLDAVKTGQVAESLIDEKVRRILYVESQTSGKKQRSPGSINTAAHLKTAYDIAAESIVLLKNSDKLLPIAAGKYPSIAVIGDNATRKFASGGFGAGVKAQHEVTVLEGIKAKFGPAATITYARGYAPARVTRGQSPVAAMPDPALLQEAVAAAKKSALAIVCIGSNREYETEGTDRKDLGLPFAEQELVNAVTAANPHTIVVVIAAAPYDLNEMQQKNTTLLWSWFNGSEGGTALADVLSGKVNPSGKLPFTFPKQLNDSPAHALHTFPGEETADYKEGILVGYRWFDTRKIEPLYCFGYGLSYTHFNYLPLTLNKKIYTSADATITLTLTVKNTGAVSGKETVQFYISNRNKTAMQPEKELRAFSKVEITAGGEKKVTATIPLKNLSWFDEQSNKWVLDRGNYTVLAAASSSDIRQTAAFSIK